ncbi:MAG: response regulator, partial [Myxococcales bacterium]|nr:response regulator [Myxococcales bacterium]
TEEGHVITLETRLEARDVIITVRDNGPGMSEEVQRRATEPFFTTKPVGVGTGLGLSVCHNLVADLGGELTIESELGRGTAIAVRLPRVQPIARTAAAPPAAIEARRLLIIDDEELVLRALRRGLVDHDVVTVSSAEEALALFETDRAFDLVLCDMMMPGRTGAELYQQVAREHPELAERFAFLTGGVYGVTEREFLESSGRPTLSKPITGDTLTELLGGPLSRK